MYGYNLDCSYVIMGEEGVLTNIFSLFPFETSYIHIECLVISVFSLTKLRFYFPTFIVIVYHFFSFLTIYFDSHVMFYSLINNFNINASVNSSLIALIYIHIWKSKVSVGNIRQLHGCVLHTTYVYIYIYHQKTLLPHSSAEW